MSKKLMLLAAAICGLSLTVVAQNPAPAASGADQKPAAEQKQDKKAEKKAGKKAAKKAGKKAAKEAKKTEEKKEAAPATK